MAVKITSQGKYVSKKSGKVVDFDYAFLSFETLHDAIDTLGEDKVLKDVQRMVKLDASNTARESAKVANGDSERKVMSEAEKAEAKADRKAKAGRYEALVAKASEAGMSVDEYLASL